MGPITHAPSLLGGDGGFPRTNEDVWDHADLDEVRREARAQIERAILWGFDVSHLDTAHSTMLLRPEFFDVYLDLAVEFELPIAMFDATAESLIGFPARDLAAEAGVLFPDQDLWAPGVDARELLQSLGSLGPGVTELPLRPAVDSAELRSITPSWGHGWTTTQSSARRTPCATRCSTQASPSLATGRCARRSAGADQPAQLGRAAGSVEAPTPAKRSSSSTSTGPMRLRARR